MQQVEQPHIRGTNLLWSNKTVVLARQWLFWWQIDATISERHFVRVQISTTVVWPLDVLTTPHIDWEVYYSRQHYQALWNDVIRTAGNLRLETWLWRLSLLHPLHSCSDITASPSNIKIPCKNNHPNNSVFFRAWSNGVWGSNTCLLDDFYGVLPSSVPLWHQSVARETLGEMIDSVLDGFPSVTPCDVSVQPQSLHYSESLYLVT